MLLLLYTGCSVCSRKQACPRNGQGKLGATEMKLTRTFWEGWGLPCFCFLFSKLTCKCCVLETPESEPHVLVLTPSLWFWRCHLISWALLCPLEEWEVWTNQWLRSLEGLWWLVTLMLFCLAHPHPSATSQVFPKITSTPCYFHPHDPGSEPGQSLNTSYWTGAMAPFRPTVLLFYIHSLEEQLSKCGPSQPDHHHLGTC